MSVEAVADCVGHPWRSTVMDELPDAGKALYEERLKLLEGLWMPAAPAWETLPDDVKERWRAHAAKPTTGGPEGGTA